MFSEELTANKFNVKTIVTSMMEKKLLPENEAGKILSTNHKFQAIQKFFDILFTKSDDIYHGFAEELDDWQKEKLKLLEVRMISSFA